MRIRYDEIVARHTALGRSEREGFVIGAGHVLINKNIGELVRAGGRRYCQAI